MQTEIQKSSAIRSGSIVLEVGPSLGSLVNVGALRDISFNQKGEVEEIVFDNVPELKKFRNGNKFSLDATLAEINWSNIAIMNDGQVAVSAVAGTLVAGAEQTLVAGGWAYGQVIELDGQNSSGLVPTINSVTAGTDGALVLNTDYNIVKLANGNWGIAIIDSVTVTTLAQDVVVNTDYTPSASKVVTFLRNGSLVEKFMRITNTNEDGKTKVYVLSGVTNVTPIAIDFAGDEENDVAVLPISLEGRVVSITDSQQTT